jgi:transposase
MQWFLDLLEESGIECQVGDARKIRAAEPRKQKHDRRDAELILKLLVEKRFPVIWMPGKELRDLRALLLHRHQWVRLRTQIQNALQAIALANGLRRGPSLWSYDGQAKIAFLPLPPHASLRRSALQATYHHRCPADVSIMMVTPASPGSVNRRRQCKAIHLRHLALQYRSGRLGLSCCHLWSPL